MNAPWSPHRAQDATALAEALRRDGFCIVRGLVDPDRIATLSAELDERFGRVGFSDGLFFGRKTKRIHGLLKRTTVTAELVLNSLVLDSVNALLLPHCDCIQLNLTQAIEIHPSELAQAPHRDQDMWQRAVPGIEYLVNVMWPMTPFTLENGGTRIWPGTHRDLSVRRPSMRDAVVAEMRPGDALLYLGSVVHGAGANVSGEVRRGLVVSYALGWLKQFENMSLTYPPEIARGFPPALTDLLGYRSHLGSLGNHDGRCPSELLRGTHDEYAGARERMSAEHRQVLETFAACQDWQ
jgi:ectoine hydroxylase-related dioxygenase (phytanoyl-CoA dioxygenase family)